jgi:hypothetical protein
MTIKQPGSASAFMFVFALYSSHAGAANVDNPDPRLGAAESGSPGAGEIRGDRRFREGVVLAASQLALESGADETSFNFAHLRDLWVRVRLAGVANPVQLNLRLIDPNGTLIYEASVPYASDPTITTMDVPGAGHPVPVFQAKALRGGVALDYALPVSGSVVTRYSSEGTWTFVAEAGGRKFSTSIDVSTGY